MTTELNNIKNIHIIGLGLIGCSIAQNIKTKTNINIFGIDHNKSHREKALDLNFIHHASGNLYDTAPLELVIIATPLSAIESVFKTLKEHIDPNTIITDVGSVKRSVINSAKKILGEDLAKHFIPGHPLAGRAVHGPEAALIDLFNHKKIILTPFDPTQHNSPTLKKIEGLWQLCGTHDIEVLDADRHDIIAAQTSHLPQLISYSYMNSFKHIKDYIAYGPGGFGYLTQLATSDAIMWRDVCVANKNQILESIKNFRGYLDEIEENILNNNSDELINLFNQSINLKKGG